MADFTINSVVKSAKRDLESAIVDLNSYSTIITNILTDNPWGCVSYETAGETIPAVRKTKESYGGKVLYKDSKAKTLGSISIKAPTTSGFSSTVAKISGTAAYTTAMGAASASHNSSDDRYSCSLAAHDPNGENYNVTFNRNNVVMSSYTDNAIRTKLDTWADSVPALA